MAEAKRDAEGFAEDAPSIPTPRAVKLENNKYDGTGNPDCGEWADIPFRTAENDFPRQTGHDSMTEEETVLS